MTAPTETELLDLATKTVAATTPLMRAAQETMKQAGDAIKIMAAAITAKDHALTKAKEKLAIYRETAGGEYKGGMEYSALVRLIEEAIAL